LREIEKEDNNWRENQKSAQEQEKNISKVEKQPAQKSKEKESVVPASGSADDEKKPPSTRKLNFF
jgi:hypothetical protein